MTKEPKGCPTSGACSALKELAASRAREAKPREAIGGTYSSNYQSQELRRNALAIPLDDTALQERLKQERERCEEAAIEAWKAGKDLAAAIRALT